MLLHENWITLSSIPMTHKICLNFWTSLEVTVQEWKKSESVSDSVLFDSATPWAVACQTVQGILQARILEWVAIPFSRGSSLPRDWIWVSCITIWATREALNISKEVAIIVVSGFFGPHIYYCVQTITWGNYTFHKLHLGKSQFQTIYNSFYVYNFHFCV